MNSPGHRVSHRSSNPNKNDEIKITYFRHAESCGNKDIQHFTDEYPKNYTYPDNIGYGKLDNPNTDLTKSKKVELKLDPNSLVLIKAFGTNPNLSFIGMQQAILMGMDFFSKEANNYDIYCSSATVRTIMTALMALRGKPTVIYVVPFVTEKTHNLLGTKDMQNMPVHSSILKKIVTIIKEWLRDTWISNFDDIELITNLNYLKINLTNTKISDIINFHINAILTCKITEKLNPKKCHDEMLLNLKRISYILDNNKDIYSSITKKNEYNNLVNFFNMFQTDRYKEYYEGPPVDFTILEYFEKNPPSEIITNKLQIGTVEMFSLFRTKVVQHIFQQKNNISKIAVFSHGNIIKEYFNISKNTEILNTQGFTEKTPKNNLNQSSKDINPVYNPQQIRSNYKNFEILNLDICDIKNGLRGIINQELFTGKFNQKIDNTRDSIQKQIDGKTASIRSASLSAIRKPHSLFDDKIRKQNQDGGYYDKYKKYKIKYLELNSRLDGNC
jgi:hypothetical protein